MKIDKNKIYIYIPENIITRNIALKNFEFKNEKIIIHMNI